MIPEVTEKKDVLVQILRRMEFDTAPEDDDVRDSPALREQMTLLIPALHDLIYEHAQALGSRIEMDCPFQVDILAEWLLWQTVEFLTQAQHDAGNRLANVKAHQLTRRHAEFWADWPPSPESEV